MIFLKSVVSSLMIFWVLQQSVTAPIEPHSESGSVDDASESWALAGSSAKEEFRTVEVFVSRVPSGGYKKHAYELSEEHVDIAPLNTHIRSIILNKKPNGEIEHIQVFMANDVIAAKGVDSFKQDGRIAEHIRSSLLCLLIGLGELEWNTSEGDNSIATAKLPDGPLQLSFRETSFDNAVFLEGFSDLALIKAEAVAPDLAIAAVLPNELKGAYYIWIRGPLDKPNGVTITYGFPMERFGYEFESVTSWAKLVRKMGDDYRQTQRELRKMAVPLERASPGNLLDEYQKKDLHLTEEWIWEIYSQASASMTQQVGLLKMKPLGRATGALRNWKNKTFTIEPLEAASAEAKLALERLPRKIICRRNDSYELSKIETYYSLPAANGPSDATMKQNALNSLGLLLSIGALDYSPPVSEEIDTRILPIGRQRINLAINAQIGSYILGNNEMLHSVEMSELGIAPNAALQVEWRRTLRMQNEFNRAFSGHLLDISTNGLSEMKLMRAFGVVPGNLFYAPQAAECKCVGNDHDMDSLNLLLLRKRPGANYLLYLRQLRSAHLKEQLLTTNAEALRSSDVNVLSRLPELTSWLSVEEAGLVLRTLVMIDKAKLAWGRDSGASRSAVVNWRDIAQYMDIPRSELPRPRGGEYVLGDELVSLPSYRQPKGNNK